MTNPTPTAKLAALQRDLEAAQRERGALEVALREALTQGRALEAALTAERERADRAERELGNAQRQIQQQNKSGLKMVDMYAEVCGREAGAEEENKQLRERAKGLAEALEEAIRVLRREARVTSLGGMKFFLAHWAEKLDKALATHAAGREGKG